MELRKRFENKVAVVTGAAQGIGRRTAIDLAAEGAKVVVSDVDMKGIGIVVKEIEDAGGKALGICCDVSSSKNVESLINQTVETFGSVDILVNNAGILLTGSIEETTDEVIDKTLDINVKGVLYAIRAVTPIMKKQRYGKIVNLSSITGKNGDNSSVFVYGGSKGAIMSITRSVARQLGPYGINVNAAAPHAVMTNLMKYWTDEKKREAAEKIPLKRLATEEDIAHLLLFLASDESSFITGETVNINGGYYMD